jgi:hypothetical protein
VTLLAPIPVLYIPFMMYIYTHTFAFFPVTWAPSRLWVGGSNLYWIVAPFLFMDAHLFCGQAAIEWHLYLFICSSLV